MEIKNNCAYFEVHRAYKYEMKAFTIIAIIATILFSASMIFSCVYLSTRKVDKPIANEIKSIESIIHDDYKKAASLDERTSIEIYNDEIIVQVNTMNFLLKEYYDKDGNFVKSVIQGKLNPFEIFVVIIGPFAISLLAIFIGKKIIKNKLEKLRAKDIEENKMCHDLKTACFNLAWKKETSGKDEIEKAQREYDALKKKYNISKDINSFSHDCM